MQILIIMYNLFVLPNTIFFIPLKYSMTTITYPNSKLVFTDENGNTGTTILPESITTPSITVSSIADSNGSTGASGYVLSSTGDGIAWISPPSSSIVPTGTDLNMNNNDIINVNTITTTNLIANTITSATTFTNQVTFSTQPISSIIPQESNHLVNKSYVDSVAANNSISDQTYKFFLNASQTTTATGTLTYVLSNTFSTSTNSIDLGLTITTATTPTLFATFVSNPINITEIPNSLWQLNFFAAISDISEIFSISFDLRLYRNNVYIPLGSTSSNAGDINITPTLYPKLYSINLEVPTTTTYSSDLLVLRVYYSRSAGTSVNFSFYCEHNFYSYLSVCINKMFPFNNSTDLFMNGYNINSTSDMTVSVPSNKLLILGSSGPTVLIGSANKNVKLLESGNTGIININKLFTPSYTTFPTTGQIGEVVTVAPFTPQLFNLGTSTIQTQTINLTTCTLPYSGSWYIIANACLNCTTAVGTISSITITITNITKGTIECNENITGSIPSQLGQNNNMNCAGFIKGYGSDVFQLSQTISYTGLNAQYATYSASNFVWKFVRFA
jgi:hypothetical protein